MSDGKIVPLQLTPARATILVRRVAAETANVILGDHALERMAERTITDTEVYRILRFGDVLDVPTRTPQKEWKCKVVMRLKGNRTAGVVTIILHNGKLFAQTIEWEDRR